MRQQRCCGCGAESIALLRGVLQGLVVGVRGDPREWPSELRWHAHTRARLPALRPGPRRGLLLWMALLGVRQAREGQTPPRLCGRG